MTQRPNACPCRRRFIQLTVLGSAAAAAGALLSGCGAYEVDTLSEDVDIDLTLYPELESAGDTALVDLEQLGLPLAVTRTGPGEEDFLVTSTECNHRGCGVERSGEGWKCPCHGATFALDGALRKGPATSGLIRYDFIVEEGVMTVLAAD